MWMYIVGAIALVLVAFFLSPIVVSVVFDGERLRVWLRFWLIRYTVYPQKEKPKKRKKSPKKEKAKKQSSKKKKEDDREKTAPKSGVVQKVKDIFGVLGTLFHGSLRLLENGRIRKLNLTLGITGEDAAKAAINYGLVCSAVYPFLGLVDNHMKLKNPKVNIYCDYLNQEPTVQGSGKIYISVYHAVGTALFMIKELVFKHLKHKRWL